MNEAEKILKEVDAERLRENFFRIIPERIHDKIYDIEYFFFEDPKDYYRKEFVMVFWYKGQRLNICLRIWNWREPRLIEEFKTGLENAINIIDNGVSSSKFLTRRHPKDKSYIG